MKTLLPIGTTGVAAYDIVCLAGIIKKGTRVTITGFDKLIPSRGYELIDEHGFKVIEAGFDCIIPDKNNQK